MGETSIFKLTSFRARGVEDREPRTTRVEVMRVLMTLRLLVAAAKDIAVHRMVANGKSHELDTNTIESLNPTEVVRKSDVRSLQIQTGSGAEDFKTSRVRDNGEEKPLMKDKSQSASISLKDLNRAELGAAGIFLCDPDQEISGDEEGMLCKT